MLSIVYHVCDRLHTVRSQEAPQANVNSRKKGASLVCEAGEFLAEVLGFWATRCEGWR